MPETLSSTGNNGTPNFCETEIASLPYRFVAVGVVFQSFYIQFSSFRRSAGSAFLCDQNLSSCSPNSRPQNVSSYTATLQDIRFGIKSLYLSRKSSLLLHKKCNNCRIVAKLKYKSFVCTNLVRQFCALVTYFHEQKRYLLRRKKTTAEFTFSRGFCF